MALEKYKEKRHFDKTPEPTGGTPNSDKLLFVVQEHHASHHHYDFRLELRGILKSWAVPHGPSTNPDEHRLATLVEDHPYDYRSFEGIIPSGYGKGTVIVWDEGWYEPAVDENGKRIKGKAEQEHWLTAHFWKNAIKITLHGKKLKGDWILIRAPERKKETDWLLVKAEDKYASPKDILLKNKSVVSGLTLKQLAASDNPSEWQSHRLDSKSKKEKVLPPNEDTFPEKVEPMLATKVTEVTNNPDWLYEKKIDGYRILAYKRGDRIVLRSRKEDYTKKYPAIVEALKAIPHDFIIDGEAAVLNKDGVPDFEQLQNYRPGKPITCFAFDILWLNGYDLKTLPLEKRKALLNELLPTDKILTYCESYEDGEALFEEMKTTGWEGIVCKLKESSYQPGVRSNYWLKLQTKRQEEFIVGGYTESESNNVFRSLIFGNYRDGKLHYVGHTGHFSDKQRAEIYKRIKPLEIKKSPFVNDVKHETKLHYLKPELVIVVKFDTYTKSGSIRKPAIFIAFREDKEPKEVVADVESSDPIVEEPEQPVSETPTVSTQAELDSNWKIILNRKITSEHEFEIAGHKLMLHNMEQEVWHGVKRADLITYYHSISKYIIPYLKDRPISPHIKHNGVNQPGMYQKDMEGHAPEFVEICSVKRKIAKAGKRPVIDYAMVNNEASLLYFVDLQCIDFNPFSARKGDLYQSDYISIDLDPTDDDFSKIITTAQAVKEVLDKNKLQAVVKTSGKRGIHVFIPCIFHTTEAKALGKKIYDQVHEIIPDITTDIFNKSQRNGRVFVDYTLNDYSDTLASVYSCRPYHVPSVSTPLEWREVKETLHPTDFTIFNTLERIKDKGDLFKDLLNEKWIKKNSSILKSLL